MLQGRDVRDIAFGVPKKGITKKVDAYEGKTMLIMHEAPDEKGKTYKFELTKLALESLDLARESSQDEKVVSFSFQDDKIIIANTTSLKGQIEEASQYNISMEGMFSNKNCFEYIAKSLNLNTFTINEFNLITNEGLGVGIPSAVLELVVKEEEKVEPEVVEEILEQDASNEKEAINEDDGKAF